MIEAPMNPRAIMGAKKAITAAHRNTYTFCTTPKYPVAKDTPHLSVSSFMLLSNAGRKLIAQQTRKLSRLYLIDCLALSPLCVTRALCTVL